EAPPPAPAVSISIPPPPVEKPKDVVPKPKNDAPSLPPPHRHTSEPVIPYRFPKWIFVGAAGVLLLILGLNLRKPAEVASRPPVASESRPVEIPATVIPPPAPAPVAKAAPSAPKPSTVPGKAIWRVIAFTYRTHEAAAKKVKQLNQYHPDLHATVFTPKDRHGYYLVALGGRMTHDEAV